MTRIHWAGTMLVALLALSVAAAPTVLANGRPLKASMDGASVVSVAGGDPDGIGIARLRLNHGRGRVCFRIEVTDVTLPATAADIHAGEAGVAGAVVVALVAPDVTGASEGCVTDVARSLIKDMRKNPADYYVDVHTSDFPDGAVRGQLAKWAPGHP